MQGLIAALGAVMAGYAVGYAALAGTGLNKRIASCFERTVFSAALGAGILSFIVFILGVCGFIYPTLFTMLLAVLTALALLSYSKDLRKTPKSEHIAWSKFDKVLLYVLFGTGFLHLVLSFRPNTNFDSLSHMILLPKWYIASHTIYNVTQLGPYFSYPQLFGMLDMLVMAVSDEVAVNHLHLLYGFLTCALLYITGKNTANRAVGLVSAATLITLGVFFDMAGIGKIDIGIALFTAAIFYCLTRWRSDSDNLWFYFSVLFCSWGFGVKYNGLLLLLLPVAVLIENLALKKVKPAEFFKLTVVSAVVFTLGAAHWLLLNTVYTNAPLSPFLAKLFNDTSQTPLMREFVKGYFDKASSGYFAYIKDVMLGMPVLFLAFLPFGMKNYARKSSLVLGALFFAIGNYFFLHADRVFFPVFVLWSLAVGNVVYSIFSFPVKTIKYSLIFIYLAMLLNGTYAVANEIFRNDNFPYFSGRQSKDEFLRKNVSCYALAAAANKITGPGETVWGLAESRGYYFNARVFPGFSRLGFALLEDPSSERVAAAMRKNDVNYVIFSTEPYFYERQPRIFNDSQFLADYFELSAKEGDFCLYKLKQPGKI